MRFTILLPMVISLAVLPNISFAQNKDTLQYKVVQQHQNKPRAPAVNKRVVYKTGAVIRKAPTNGLALRFGGVSFIFNEGLYYRHVNQVYTVVRPPVGLRVSYLPNGYEHIIIKGRPYYFLQGIYYVFDNGDYRVIEEPISDDTDSDSPSQILVQSVETASNTSFQLGKAYDSLPQGAQSVLVNDQQYFKYHDIYFLPQSSGNSVYYLAVKLE